MATSRQRVVLALSLIGLIVLGAGYSVLNSRSADAKQASSTPQATPVGVATVISRKVMDWRDYSGRLEAVERIDIRPQVSGALAAVHFHDGAIVRQGDLLFTIDPRPFEAELARTQANLAAAEARVAFAGMDLARSQRLLADNAIARRDFDSKENAALEAGAAVQAARAAVDSARLNLGYTRITAPVAGRVSRAEVSAGNVVAAGAASQSLTTLVSVAKIFASFDVDEQSFLQYINPARGSKNSSTPVYLGLGNETGFAREGRISSVDNRLDASSGTIRVRAVFDNADGSLLPGLYARIRLGSGVEHEAVLIDEKAVGTDQNKRFVLVVDSANRTAYREIRLGALQGGLRVVESGLKAGERIVLSGLQRVRPGDTVAPQDLPMAFITGSTRHSS